MRRNVLITGASSGLGAGMARILAAKGYDTLTPVQLSVLAPELAAADLLVVSREVSSRPRKKKEPGGFPRLLAPPERPDAAAQRTGKEGRRAAQAEREDPGRHSLPRMARSLPAALPQHAPRGPRDDGVD